MRAYPRGIVSWQQQARNEMRIELCKRAQTLPRGLEPTVRYILDTEAFAVAWARTQSESRPRR